MIEPFTFEGKVIVGPRSYINKILGEDIRLHTVFWVEINGMIWTRHSRLGALVLCTDEDLPWPQYGTPEDAP